MNFSKLGPVRGHSTIQCCQQNETHLKGERGSKSIIAFVTSGQHSFICFNVFFLPPTLAEGGIFLVASFPPSV